ncbi:MAG TPA: hypothetical protein VHC49_24190 [Mycobacteriales bacterium]|nr:hypothetical protein [Mycobacteriales bacterium]
MRSAGRYGDGSSTGGEAHSGPVAAGDEFDVLALDGSLLRGLESLEDLASWRDEVIHRCRRVILGDVSIGAGPPVVRPAATSTVETLLAAGIDRMRKNGELAVDADPSTLATGLTAALHGGLLLARTVRDAAPLEVALDVALSCVRSHSAR